MAKIPTFADLARQGIDGEGRPLGPKHGTTAHPIGGGKPPSREYLLSGGSGVVSGNGKSGVGYDRDYNLDDQGGPPTIGHYSNEAGK
jgi:hypothetical protein